MFRLPTLRSVLAEISKLLPAKIDNRNGWAVDIFAAFEALSIRPTAQNICAVIAVTEQESTFHSNPQVPGLPAIARREIEARAARYNIPMLAVNAALGLQSPTGASYRERLAKVKTEKELSEIFADFSGMVPLGERLFGSLNPVHTGGPMQVSIAAVSILSKTPLALDGDLLRHGCGADQPSNTELAVRKIAGIELDAARIRRDLELGEQQQFADTTLYQRVFALAAKARRSALPRAVVPTIRLQSPKITRKLTTDWFARRVDERYEKCLARGRSVS